MKEIYAWVPWFKELARKIADGNEQQLADAAERIPWKKDGGRHAILDDGPEKIDPFSMFYTLAANSGTVKSRERIYNSLSNVFGLQSELPLDLDEVFVFPMPPPFNTLFHSNGQGDPQLLWRLFRSAVSGFGDMESEEFSGALAIDKVAPKKLTQALFLVNPEEFLPIDDSTTTLGLFPFRRVPNPISLGLYADLIDRARKAFRGCSLFEINLFAYRRWTQSKTERLTVRPERCFQVSTNIDNMPQDHWPDFRDGNHIYTGAPGGPGGDKQSTHFPLDKPERGDVVLVRAGRGEGRGVGIVWRNEYNDGGWAENKRVHVLWLNKESAKLASLEEATPVTGLSEVDDATRNAFRAADAYAPTFDLLDRLFPADKRTSTRSPEPPIAPEPPKPGKPDTVVDYPRNLILYGPPGTGKTWHTTAYALAVVHGAPLDAETDRTKFEDLRFDPGARTGQIAMVTFHQNYSYEDFIEGIRPTMNGGSIAYELRDGIFKCIAEAAAEKPDRRFVLIIDEINRGNIAKIFGELITLIEDSRRIGRSDQTHVTLPYSRHRFGVPDNLYLIGTMNTADRSIQLLDAALRRRFTFREMMPDYEHTEITRDIEGVDCARMLAAINERVGVLLDREHQIGHTYLLRVDAMDKLAEAFGNRIFPLLQEYFFNDWAKIRAVLGNNAFVSARDVGNLQVLGEFADEERKLYERLPETDPRWRDPAEYRRIYDGGDEGGDAGEPEDC